MKNNTKSPTQTEVSENESLLAPCVQRKLMTVSFEDYFLIGQPVKKTTRIYDAESLRKAAIASFTSNH